MVTTMAEAVNVELGGDQAPTAVHWRGRRYTVTDEPTLLEDLLAPAVMHPPAIIGWRFQGTNNGTSYVFDVRRSPAGRWELLRVYR